MIVAGDTASTLVAAGRSPHLARQLQAAVAEAGRALLAAQARRPWSHRYLRDQVAANPRYHLREPGAAPDTAFRDRLVDGGYDWYVASHLDPVRPRTT